MCGAFSRRSYLPHPLDLERELPNLLPELIDLDGLRLERALLQDGQSARQLRQLLLELRDPEDSSGAAVSVVHMMFRSPVRAELNSMCADLHDHFVQRHPEEVTER
jgi:hypothetical protein